MRVAARRRSDEGHKFASFFAEHERMVSRIPIDIGSSKSSRPFELKVRDKRCLNLQRLFSFDLKQNNRSLFIQRDTKRLANAEGIPRIKNRSRLRANGKRTCQTLGRKGTVVNVERQVKFTKDLQRINPRLKSSRLIAEQSGSVADYGQELPRSDGPSQFGTLHCLLRWRNR